MGILPHKDPGISTAAVIAQGRHLQQSETPGKSYTYEFFVYKASDGECELICGSSIPEKLGCFINKGSGCSHNWE